MGDVVTALSRAVQDEGHRVDVFVPKYDILNTSQIQDLYLAETYQHANTNIQLWKGTVEGLTVSFIDPQNGMFQHGCIYGRGDDHVRFRFFAEAVGTYIRQMAARGEGPNIVHAHDWQTAPLTWENLAGAKTAFTIHNLEYGADLIAGAMGACTVATTVSPTYAAEVAGHGAVRDHAHKFMGIINGIDYGIWNPLEDAFLPRNYDDFEVAEGKAAAKEALQQRLDLHKRDVPVIGVVSRLVHQKGIHLIRRTCWRTLEKGGQFVLLGSSPDGNIQRDFEQLMEQAGSSYPNQVRCALLPRSFHAGARLRLAARCHPPCDVHLWLRMA